MDSPGLGARARLLALAAALMAAAACAHAADAAKVLHVASDDILSLDPQQPGGIASTRLATNVFQALYTYDYFGDSGRAIPDAAAGPPEVRDDGRTWTIRLRAGLHFTDDPAFHGHPRELCASDYVYALMRAMDPHLRTGGNATLAALIEGGRAWLDAARAPQVHTDYDHPPLGLQAPDCHTLVLRLVHADYTLPDRLTALETMAVAREVVEASGPDIVRHPVGTGPYRLVRWVPGSHLTFEANPGYATFAFPSPSTASETIVARPMAGRALPQIGRVEVSIVEESRARLLAFERGDLDYLGLAGNDAAGVMERGSLAPSLAARGVTLFRAPAPSLSFTLFDLGDPVVGGYAPERVALRRAVALGFDTGALIDVLYAGVALPADQPLPPGVRGHDADAKARGLYDPDAARALLDRYGYAARDTDGYRMQPDGRRLTLVRGSPPQSWYRDIDALWKKDMDAIGLRTDVHVQAFPELVRQMATGEIAMLTLSLRVLDPSGDTLFQGLWGDPANTANLARFHSAEYDAAYVQFVRTPDGPARLALEKKMADLVAAYAPLVVHTFGVDLVITQPWLRGYWPSPFGFGWKYLDVDAQHKTAVPH